MLTGMPDRVRPRLLIDCDPGHDDAVAIVAASVTRDDPTDGIADSASALPAEPPATPLLPPKLLKLLSGVA